MADNCKSRFGRRRPFIAAGVAICSMGLILLGFTRNFASIITTWGSRTVYIPLSVLMPSSGRSLEFQNDLLTIWLAVFAIYCIDFSINAGEFSTCLSLYVPIGGPDKAVSASRRSCPSRRYPSSCRTSKRERLGCSHVGYWQRGRIFLVSVANKAHSLSILVLNQDSGGINMPSLLPFLGHTELEVLSVIGVILLIGTHLATVASVKERILLTSGYAQVLFTHPPEADPYHYPRQKKKSFLQELNEIWVNAWNLPPVIRQIVRVTPSLSANELLMGTFVVRSV